MMMMNGKIHCWPSLTLATIYKDGLEEEHRLSISNFDAHYICTYVYVHYMNISVKFITAVVYTFGNLIPYSREL
jgi:hypothetical protein